MGAEIVTYSPGAYLNTWANIVIDHHFARGLRPIVGRVVMEPTLLRFTQRDLGDLRDYFADLDRAVDLIDEQRTVVGQPGTGPKPRQSPYLRQASAELAEFRRLVARVEGGFSQYIEAGPLNVDRPSRALKGAAGAANSAYDDAVRFLQLRGHAAALALIHGGGNFEKGLEIYFSSTWRKALGLTGVTVVALLLVGGALFASRSLATSENQVA